jgi:hypothetical protein
MEGMEEHWKIWGVAMVLLVVLECQLSLGPFPFKKFDGAKGNT